MLLGPDAAVPLTAHAADVLVHTGLANASAAVPVGDRWFATAGGDDNVVRVYPTDRGGPPVATLRLPGRSTLLHHAAEFDLEAGARIGDIVYWIGSHGRAKDGRERPARQQFLATRITATNDHVRMESFGSPCTSLLQVLLADPRYQALGFAAAAGRPPEEDGINVEGLCDTPEGTLLVGFRSPLPEERAVLAPLLNPAEAVDGREPRFGDPVRLDLGGRGVRDMARSGTRYYILAGSEGSGGNTVLYRWDGPGTAPERVDTSGLKRLNPEGLAVFGKEKKPRLLVVSDDGRHQKPGTPPSFRSVWVRP